jgi:Ser/Thr protein kinase RdoA (MazF antagonist)
MTGPFFPVQRSLLSEEALAEQVLCKYDLPAPLTCRFWQRGINDAYLVQAAGEKWVLRVAPAGWWPAEELAAELDVLRFLGARQIRVPQPIAQRDGTYIETLRAPEGVRHAVLFDFCPGRPASSMDEAHARRYGQAIARLHVATDDYPADRARHHFGVEQMVDQPLARARHRFVDHPDDYAYLVELAPALRKAANSLPCTAPLYGICHGDVNNGNIHFLPEGDWALVDFEYVGYGWRVMDVATFVSNAEHATGRTPGTRRVQEAFIEGYGSVRALSKADLTVLPEFVVMRTMWLFGVIAIRNRRNSSRAVYDHWVFDLCMPFIRAWMEEGW